MKNVFAAIVALTLAGCATYASPQFVNGGYYMGGDAACVRWRALSNTQIMCQDKKGNDTGYREAMTVEQMQMYQAQILYQQAQMQQITEQMRQTGQTFQNAGQQISQQSQQYSAPQVQPITPQGGYGGTTYRAVGNTWMGSDGSSCQVVGQSILCSNGKTCQLVGQNLICN